MRWTVRLALIDDDGAKRETEVAADAHHPC
jgi:hypothetical protein